MEEFTLSPKFDIDSLTPAIIQDAESGQVLMMAWMNREAYDLTLTSGQVHFWSRSRREIWRKGATSGHTLSVREMRIDCDADALLVRVDAAGPACHTGQTSCFFQVISSDNSGA